MTTSDWLAIFYYCMGALSIIVFAYGWQGQDDYVSKEIFVYIGGLGVIIFIVLLSFLVF